MINNKLFFIKLAFLIIVLFIFGFGVYRQWLIKPDQDLITNRQLLKIMMNKLKIKEDLSLGNWVEDISGQNNLNTNQDE